MRLLLAFLAPLALLAQFKIGQIRIIPTTDGTGVGQIEFDTTRADNKAIVLKAPNTATAGYTLTLPTAAPASNGLCLVGTTAGVLSFATCGTSGAVLTTTNQEVEGFKYFGVSASDRLVMYRIAENEMGLQTMLDGQTDPTTYSYGGVNNKLLLQPRAGVVGIGAVDTSFLLNVAGTFRATGAATFSSTLGVTGLSTLTGGATLGAALSPSVTDTHDIGSATRFRNIYGQAINGASIEIANSTFVTTFWRHSLNSAATYRIESGSGSQIEMQMGTISSTSSDVGFRGTLYPLSTSGSNGDLGFSGTPWRALYLSTGFRLTGGAAAGRVLTSDASGNGTWAVPALSPWTTSGSDIYYSTGSVGMGTTTPNHRLDVEGAARIFNGTITNDSGLYIGNGDESPGAGAFLAFVGSATPPRLEINAITQGVSWRDISLANLGGNVCVGCTGATNKLEVTGNTLLTGTLGVTGAATFSSTLGVTGLSTLTGGATLGAALSPSVTDTHDIGSATRFRNIYGQAINGASIEIANSTFVTTFWRHSLNSAATYRIESGSGSQIEMQMGTISSTSSDVGFRGTLYPLSTSGSNGDLGFSGTPWRALYLSTGFRLTGGAAAGRVLTSDASGNGTWIAPASTGTVTSIATSLPISGGTITTTGTISCATCATTDTNQTITGAKTFQSSLAAAASDTYDIGSATRFRAIYGQAINGASIEVANGTFVTTFWRHSLNSASTYRISSGSGGQIEMQMGTTSSTQSDVGFRGTLYPLSTAGSNGDVGFSGTPWRTLYLSTSSFMNGTQWMDSSRNLTNLGTGTFGGSITANGGISTASGTNSTMYVGSGNLYLRTFSGADASCSGVTNGWVGFRTDTDELQICNGGSVKKVSLL